MSRGYYYRGQQFKAVGNTSAAFDNALTPNRTYELSATTDLWWRIGADASAGAGSMFLKAGERAYIKSHTAGTLRLIRNSADGNACLAEVSC